MRLQDGTEGRCFAPCLVPAVCVVFRALTCGMSIIFGVLPRIFVQPPRKDERAFDYRFVFDRRYPRV